MLKKWKAKKQKKYSYAGRGTRRPDIDIKSKNRIQISRHGGTLSERSHPQRLAAIAGF